MKYLYPYECEKRALSSPGELQAAIDSNRREGRRQSFSAALFSYSPVGTPAMLASPKGPVPALALATHGCSQLAQVHAIKKGGWGGGRSRFSGAESWQLWVPVRVGCPERLAPRIRLARAVHTATQREGNMVEGG